MNKIDRMMDKIQKLIAMADDPAATPEEAQTFRDKAESLMMQYRIEESMLIAEDPTGILPIWKRVVVGETSSEFYGWHSAIWNYIARHCGLRSQIKYEYKGNGLYDILADTVGYASDIRYAEFLHNAGRLVMISKLEPKVDPGLSEAENVYNYRSAGFTRHAIAKILWGTDNGNGPQKVTALYKKECARRNETPTVVGRELVAGNYREAYAEGFANELAHRLRLSRDAARSQGGGLVLHGRQERVDAAFTERFPPEEATPEPEEEKEDCRLCRPDSGYKCRQHRTRELTKSERDKMHRQLYGTAARLGRATGREAAKDVIIQRGEEATKGLPE